MRIHTDTVSTVYVYRAAHEASELSGATVNIEKLQAHGSRTHAGSFDVTLSGDGTLTRRRINYGTSRTLDRFAKPYAATWEQWGFFLAAMFRLDPAMRVGSAAHPVYRDAEHFHAETEGKFRFLTDDLQ